MAEGEGRYAYSVPPVLRIQPQRLRAALGNITTHTGKAWTIRAGSRKQLESYS
jgi:hypothetical protein